MLGVIMLGNIDVKFWRLCVVFGKCSKILEYNVL